MGNYMSHTWSKLILTIVLSRTLYPSTDPPGYVPSYDPLEQQLLASIEQELGV
jgi:hypothetical protein